MKKGAIDMVIVLLLIRGWRSPLLDKDMLAYKLNDLLHTRRSEECKLV